MANMPNRNFLTSGATTEAQFQSGIGDLYDVVNQLGIIGQPEQLGIVLGSVTPTKSDIIVDTENLAATDLLDLIVPTNVGEKMIFVRAKNASRPVTLTHLASGTGKLSLATQTNTVLTDPKYVIALKWDATNAIWVEYWRNFGIFVAAGDEGTIRTQLNLGTASTRNTGMSTGQIPLRENFGSAAFINTGTSSGQIPLANQLGSLAFKSLITNADMDGTGVVPGNYSAVQVNAQGRVIGGANSQVPIMRVYKYNDGNTAWIKPAGLSYIEVAVVGAGGGGATFPNAGVPSAGGTTSFGGLVAATGGAPGLPGSNTGAAAGGVGVAGQYLIAGMDGKARTGGVGGYFAGGDGASIPFFITGGKGGQVAESGQHPGGGGSSGGSQGDRGGGGGGGGGAWSRIPASDLPASVTLTMGAHGGGPYTNGGDGWIVVWEYY